MTSGSKPESAKEGYSKSAKGLQGEKTRKRIDALTSISKSVDGQERELERRKSEESKEKSLSQPCLTRDISLKEKRTHQLLFLLVQLDQSVLCSILRPPVPVLQLLLSPFQREPPLQLHQRLLREEPIQHHRSIEADSVPRGEERRVVGFVQVLQHVEE